MQYQYFKHILTNIECNKKLAINPEKPKKGSFTARKSERSEYPYNNSPWMYKNKPLESLRCGQLDIKLKTYLAMKRHNKTHHPGPRLHMITAKNILMQKSHLMTEYDPN